MKARIYECSGGGAKSAVVVDDVEDMDNYCSICEEVRAEGCAHFSPCCGAPVIELTDCCSICKEHTGIDNT